MIRRLGNVMLWFCVSLVGLMLVGFVMAGDAMEARRWLFSATVFGGLTWCARYVFAGRKGI